MLCNRRGSGGVGPTASRRQSPASTTRAMGSLSGICVSFNTHLGGTWGAPTTRAMGSLSGICVSFKTHLGGTWGDRESISG